ncbi:Calmodulin [Orchesella cincta]|uniref:Calmodulin n=1 Tax=Orchesella cincta TaxID=48709 RepID=A0A1D2NBJ0_ORCCI|nr:Calmodulin [Orchesella cincta]
MRSHFRLFQILKIIMISFKNNIQLQILKMKTWLSLGSESDHNHFCSVQGASTSSATSSFAAATAAASSSASASFFTGAGPSAPFVTAQVPTPQHLEELPGVAKKESSFSPQASMECLSPTETAPNPKIGETMNEFESIRQSLDSLKIQSKLSETQMQGWFSLFTPLSCYTIPFTISLSREKKKKHVRKLIEILFLVCSQLLHHLEFREAFRFFDKDGDGSITKDELGIVMRSLGQFASEEELKEMLKEVDINGDGLFSFEEFVEIVSNYSGNTGGSTDEEQELRDAFRIFDKHNRGYISASDLRAVLHCLGEDLSEDEIEDMIKEVDVDGDGRIDFNEFVRALGEPDLTEEDEDVEDAECEYQFTQ